MRCDAMRYDTLQQHMAFPHEPGHTLGTLPNSAQHCMDMDMGNRQPHLYAYANVHKVFFSSFSLG